MYTVRGIWRTWRARQRRTFLVILSIAVSTLALATVIGARAMLETQLREGFLRAQPADIVITTADHAVNYLETIATLPDMAAVEYTAVFHTRWETSEGVGTLKVIAVPDLEAKQINQLEIDWGSYPVDGGLLVERTAVRLLTDWPPAPDGLTAVIWTPSGEQQIRIEGTVYDPTVSSTVVQEIAVGYVELEAAQALLGKSDFIELQIRVRDTANVEVTGQRLLDELEEAGLPIFAYQYRVPGDFPGRASFVALLQLMNLFSLFALALSGCIIANTVMTIMKAETPHIGTLKAIGAGRKQIYAAYLPGFVGYGLVGTLIGLGGSLFTINWLTSYMGTIANIDVAATLPPPGVLGVTLISGILLPVVTAWLPLWRASRLPASSTLHSYGISTPVGRATRWISHEHNYFGHLAWSLRNMLQAGGRSIITIVALTIAGLCFVAVFAVSASLNQTINSIATTVDADIFTLLDLPIANDTLDRQLDLLQGEAEVVEYWIRQPIQYEQQVILVNGLSPTTELYAYQDALIAGRWFRPDETYSLVVTEKFLESSLYALGDTIRLDIGNSSRRWQIVGVVRDYTNQGRLFLAPYEALSTLIEWPEEANVVLLRLQNRDGPAIADFLSRYTRHMISTGYDAETVTLQALEQEGAAQMSIIISFLAVMALLIGIIALLGLASTLGIHVTERTREIGVMRAVGGSGLQVAMLFWLESLWLGTISWTAVLILGFPVTRLLVGLVDQLMFPVEFTFPAAAFALWAICLLIVITLASALPVVRAARLPVNAILRYG